MLEIDDLLAASTTLRGDGALCRAAAEEIREVHGRAAYRDWLCGGLAERAPFRLPDAGPALTRLGFSREGILRLKINELGERLFLTDGIWVRPTIRVFPFADESRALLRFAEAAGLDGWAESVVDLATGCGHTALGLRGGSDRVGLDVSPRALAFAALNRLLAGLPPDRVLLALNDIRDGIPPALAGSLGRRVLVLANMPFGPTPARGVLPPTSDGGASGADLQVATLDAIARYGEEAAGGRMVRACLLALTVGDRDRDRWDVVERARARFGAERVSWHLLPDEKVFRIGGRRELDNPAPVAAAFPRIAECRLYVREEDAPALRTAYRDLAAAHKAAGAPDIAYGIVQIAVSP